MARTELVAAFLRSLVVAALALALGSCVDDPPVTPPGPIADSAGSGVLVVNEGVWFQDNATLTLYRPADRTVVQDFFARRNPGERLGDTGNDIVVRGNRAYIVVSTSQNIEVVDLPSGASRGHVRIGRRDPRKLAFVDDSTAYVTLLDDDEIVRFDPRTLTVVGSTHVGPAPEGIAAVGRRLFVANSGYGYLRRTEPKAGTVSVVDVATGEETALLAPGPNPVGVRGDSLRGLVYVLYGMPGADSSGGVVAFDAATLREVRRWEVRGAGVAGEMALDAERGLVYAIDGTGNLVRIDVRTSAAPTRLLAEPPSRLGFYGVGVSPLDGAIYASVVTSYTLPGSVLVLERDGAVRDRFDAGLNPCTFGFF
jgi:DNA-binding beta-propeller fold protein YncE